MSAEAVAHPARGVRCTRYAGIAVPQHFGTSPGMAQTADVFAAALKKSKSPSTK